MRGFGREKSVRLSWSETAAWGQCDIAILLRLSPSPPGPKPNHAWQFSGASPAQPYAPAAPAILVHCAQTSLPVSPREHGDKDAVLTRREDGQAGQCHHLSDPVPGKAAVRALIRHPHTLDLEPACHFILLGAASELQEGGDFCQHLWQKQGGICATGPRVPCFSRQ